MKLGTLLFGLVMIIVACTALAILRVLYDSRIANKAGPDWMWRGGRSDPLRSILFRENGTLRRFTRLVLTALLSMVTATAIFFLCVIGLNQFG